MPQGDQTGPASQGPMTGRRMGFCAGFNAPGCTNQGFGRGRGLGRGRGFAGRARAMPIVQPQAITEEQEKQVLQEDLKDIKTEMQEIEARLKELKK